MLSYLTGAGIQANVERMPACDRSPFFVRIPEHLHMLLNIKDTPKIGRAGLPREARRSTLKIRRWSDPLDRIGVHVPLSGEGT
jgi:hypothetical protein